MTADETLNELLVKLFKNIMEIEGKSLIRILPIMIFM